MFQSVIPDFSNQNLFAKDFLKLNIFKKSYLTIFYHITCVLYISNTQEEQNCG